MQKWTSLALLFVLSTAAALGQGGRSTILGTVTDPSGAPLPKVAVTVTNTGTQQKRTTVTSERGDFVADIVGPVCETTDYLARERTLPQVQRGEILAVRDAGAYGFTLASNYNSRPRAAEVLVDSQSYQIVRKRESYEDLVRGEKGS